MESSSDLTCNSLPPFCREQSFHQNLQCSPFYIYHIYPRSFIYEGSMLITMYYMYMCTLLLTELFYPLQRGYTPLHHATLGGDTIHVCVEHLLSTPGIDVNIKDMVSMFTEY